VTIEIGLEWNIGIEPQAKESTVALEHRRAGAAFEQDAAARTGKVAGGKLHPRFGWRDEAFEEQLDLAAARLAAVKARADDPGVVENQEIARGEQPRQIGKCAIVRLGCAGVVRRVVVDTSYFTGNYPPEVSVEACGAEGYPSPADSTARPAPLATYALRW